MELIKGAGTAPAVEDYVEHIRSGSLSAGVYVIGVGGVDDQTPHREDEVYYVAAGRATLVTDSGRAEVGPGDLVFVPAMEGHRFTEVTEELRLLVFFAPAYTGRTEKI
ncbi:cupin domain-containing protein [Phytomonospora sp. NPDC050363]|uniref:cupin domain-containing protein n=1 Tax=Phytomonospora sp. NPDC050363 TaxID=3155642 RepID=UPI003400CDFF